MGLQLEMLKLTLALLFIVVGLAYGTEYSPSFMEWLPKAPSSSGNWNQHIPLKALRWQWMALDQPPNLFYDITPKPYQKNDDKGYDKKSNGGYEHLGVSHVDGPSILGLRYGKGPKASRGIVSEEHGAEPWHGERETYGNPYRTALDLGKDVDLGSIRLPGVAEPLTLRIKVQPDPNPSKPVEEPVPEEAAEEPEKPTASRPAARGPWRHPGSTQGVIMGQPRGGGFR